MAINVVHSRVVALFVLIGKHNVLRQLPAEACRLIHIIPYTADAFIYKELLILAPPVTHFFFAKIRINRISRPYCIDIDLTLRCRCKIAVLHAFVVNRISLFQLYTRINDGYDLDAVLRQICDHLFEEKRNAAEVKETSKKINEAQKEEEKKIPTSVKIEQKTFRIKDGKISASMYDTQSRISKVTK